MLFAAACVLAAPPGCELVLGKLPPVVDGAGGADGGSGGRGGDTTCCDCDGDGVTSIACGGTDCDDHAALAHPGAKAYHAEPTGDPAVGFDWDCSGAPERDPALDKTVDCGLLGLPCKTDTGYLAKVPPPCGMGGPWGTCKQDGLGCADDVIETDKIMTCR